MTVSMYYFFLDGRRIYAEVANIIPMDRRYLDAFANEFKDVAYAIVYGNTLTALVQGATGLLGLLIAGVPHAVVWSMAMVVAALIPIGGTALVWGPVSLALFMTGHYTESLFFFVWGAVMVSTVDNLVRPRLCGSRMTLHPLLVFLSMFGGLAVFGAMGLLVGPLIAAIFMSMVRIYRRDFLHSGEPAQQQQPAPVAEAPTAQAVTGGARPT
jgi:predicted PurR-regulated permease PerM